MIYEQFPQNNLESAESEKKAKLDELFGYFANVTVLRPEWRDELVNELTVMNVPLEESGKEVRHVDPEKLNAVFVDLRKNIFKKYELKHGKSEDRESLASINAKIADSLSDLAAYKKYMESRPPEEFKPKPKQPAGKSLKDDYENYLKGLEKSKAATQQNFPDRSGTEEKRAA